MNYHQFVVYTVLTGDKEYLQDPVLGIHTDIKRICFTDNRKLESDSWEIRVFNQSDLGDERESRKPKLLPHDYLGEYEWSLYLDNSVQLKIPPESIFDSYTSRNKNFYCFSHPWRNNIYEEAEVLISVDYDDESRIREQMAMYHKCGYKSGGGLIAGTMLLRKHNEPSVIALQENWFNHVLRYSKRDQLSFPYLSWKLNFEYGKFDDELTNNKLMLWKAINSRSENVIERVPGNFDEGVYRWLNPGVDSAGMSTKMHYLKVGQKKGLRYADHNWTLNKLANKYQSDKGSIYFNQHGFAQVYELYLACKQNDSLTILEFGLLRDDVQIKNPNGPYDRAPSIEMWREYFNEAEIIGFDIADFSAVPKMRGVKIIRGDMGNVDDLNRLISDHPQGFDIIIDDASHTSHHQQITLSNMYPYLNSGGFYFIEDLHFQPSSLEKRGFAKTRYVLQALLWNKVVETPYISADDLTKIRETSEFIRLYDSQERRFGKIPLDAFAVIKKR